MKLEINHYAIEKIVNEWKNKHLPWTVMDTPLSSSDAFASSIQYFFLGSVIDSMAFWMMGPWDVTLTRMLKVVLPIGEL